MGKKRILEKKRGYGDKGIGDKEERNFRIEKKRKRTEKREKAGTAAISITKFSKSIY